MKVFEYIASKLALIEHLEHVGRNGIDNADEIEEHKDALKDFVNDYMPRGSGFDRGTNIELHKSNPNRLVFSTSYHHINEVGYYDGWTDHNVKITPSLQFGWEMTITGRNRRDIKDYMRSEFQHRLDKTVNENGEVVLP